MKTDKKIEEEIKKEFEDLLFELSPKHEVWWCSGNPEDYEDGNDHWNMFNNADFTEELWGWITSNFTPNNEVQKAVEDGVREYSKWFTKYFQEGHKYIAWVENGELKLVDENHIELTEDMLNETYLQSLDKGDIDGK